MRTGVSDQYSGESERVETNGGVAGAGPGSDVTGTELLHGHFNFKVLPDSGVD